MDGGLGSDVDDSMVQGFKLQDLLDVQVVARLQEDSEWTISEPARPDQQSCDHMHFLFP